MNILIFGDSQAEHTLVRRANQIESVKKIFTIFNHKQNDLIGLDKVQNLSISANDDQAIQQLIREENISLCINDAQHSQEFFDAISLVKTDSHSNSLESPLSSPKKSLSYASSGVSIDEGNAFVDKIKTLVKNTYRKETITSLGGFSGAFAIPKNYHSPLLVAATDGVGTKLKLATLLQQHDNIGIDLVAMCVNDLIVCGAEPLFFLDYYATSKLNNCVASEVIAGICKGCEMAGCSLIGGETAEMPGIYQPEDYDLAGFSVGMVEKDEVIDGSTIQADDVVIGLPSSGIHSNGYSLVRAVINQQQADLDQMIGNKTLAKWLLTPTKIYVKDILKLKQKLPTKAIKGLAHITGGGLIENIPRVLPDNVTVEIDSSHWEVPAIFSWLQQQGNINDQEMWRVFNMGIGMVVILSPEHLPLALKQLQSLNAIKIGVVKTLESSSDQCTIL